MPSGFDIRAISTRTCQLKRVVEICCCFKKLIPIRGLILIRTFRHFRSFFAFFPIFHFGFRARPSQFRDCYHWESHKKIKIKNWKSVLVFRHKLTKTLKKTKPPNPPKKPFNSSSLFINVFWFFLYFLIYCLLDYFH